MIRKCLQCDYKELIEIWHKSVLESHDFLNKKDIPKLKELILNQYFDAVNLFCFTKNNKILGFCGISDNKIEMLFIDPKSFRKSIGTTLINHVIKNYAVNEVDVNEQNHNAVTFYKKIGFEVVKRSELDGQGNPYPILHMVL